MQKKIRVIRTSIADKAFLKEEKPLRFKEDASCPDGIENEVINVYEEVKYQEILGLGGAVTDATAALYGRMTPAQRKEVIDALFSPEGLNLRFNRICINSSDYSEDFYTCDDVEGDTELKHFNIEHDRENIIPMLKEALKVQPGMKIFASPWSPPAWMKTNGKMELGGKLKEEYRETWALFYARFIKAYAAEGIPVWGLTVQNEAKAKQWWESCIYEAAEERDFVTGFLRPLLDREGLGATKIFCWDHNKERVVDRAMETFGTKRGRDSFDGIAVHWYSGDHFRALDATHQLFPEKTIISTENSTGADLKIPWAICERSVHDIIGNFNNYASAWVDWNLILDETGHPYHWDKERFEATGIDGYHPGMRPSTPIMYWKKKLKYEPQYYYFGQFSRYIREGAVRIASSSYAEPLETCAFLNPDGSVVLVVMNKADKDMPVVLRCRNHVAPYTMTKHSIATFLF